MRKKTLLFFTVICITIMSAMAPLKSVQAGVTLSSPKIGDVIHGFKLSEIGYDSSINANKYLFVHQKTGAKFLALKNGDFNGGFSIKFDTIAENNKGINHILEHSVMCGSQSYPIYNTFFVLSNTTYISYCNAYTYQNFTMYPICSANQAQLLKSADIYLDAVFNPNLLKEEKIFEQEGIRLELENENSDITYNGIVYNEMQGALSDIEGASYFNSNNALFPNSTQGNNSGGIPSEITTLSYDELMETYNKNYHPSNSTMVLYGDVDYEPFLKMIDENFLCNYNYKEYNIDRGKKPAFTQLQEKTYEFPVAQGTDTENSSVIELVFATTDAKEQGFENIVALDLATKLLNLDNSHLKQALLKSNIADSYEIYLDDSIYHPVVHFVALNANPERKTDFYNLIMEELKNSVTNGFDKDFVKSSLRSFEFQQEIGTTDGTALNSLVYASVYDNIFGNPMVNYSDAFKSIASKLDENILENVIKAEIVNNTSAALTVTVPTEGLLEKQQEDIAAQLANKKSSMTPEEIKALVKKTNNFNNWNNRETSQETLDSLQAVTLNEIETELKDRKITETTIDGVKLMHANADVDTVSAISMDFDLSHLTPEELLYLQFYGDMLEDGMATDNRTESQVINEKLYKTYNITTTLSAIANNKENTSAHPIFNVEYYGFQNEFTQSLDLVSDVLLNSKISEVSTYSNRTISNIKNRYKNWFAEPIYLAFDRAKAYTSQYYKYADYLHGLSYYNFIMDLEKQLKTNPTEVSNKIEAIRTKTFNKNNLTIMLASNPTGKDKFVSSMETLTQKLPSVSYPKAVYSLPTPAKREAYTSDLSVQYLVVNAPLLENDVPISGKSDVFASILDNLMLIPEVRLKGGAYGVGASFYDNNYIVYTYRDNTYDYSLKTIGNTHEFLESLSANLTQDVLDTYKLAAYGNATRITGELTGALEDLTCQSIGYTTQDKLNYLNEIKETSVVDVLHYSEYFKKLNNDLNYVVFASPSDIEADKDLFDTIIALP